MMLQIKKKLEEFGMHSFLLPVFFVLHNYLQYDGLVTGAVAVRTLVQILLIGLLFFSLLRIFIKNTAKSLQVTTVTAFVFLFYGVIKDFLGKTLELPFLSRYSVLLPLIAVVSFFLYRWILRNKDFSKINYFQNLLLLICILIDAGMVIFIRFPFLGGRSQPAKENILGVEKMKMPAERPDVYLLVFDSYPGKKFLEGFMQYDNSAFDSALQTRGFRIIDNPSSNYNRTAFSMASEFNFKYVSGIVNDTKITPMDYTLALRSIQYAAVPSVFSHMGYKLYNLSVFEIAKEQPIYKENYLKLPGQQVLLYNTLPGRIQTDILWNFTSVKYISGILEKVNEVSKSAIIANELKKRDFNKSAVDSLLVIPSENSAVPKFVYGHFYLPHPPFFYDANGISNDLNLVTDQKSFTNRQLFLSYVKYTNKLILQVLDNIITKSGKPPVIIIQSDHGFRDFEGAERNPALLFKNYMAFYFPDKNYSSLYDTLSNINTFPLLFNKYFNTHIPLQKDSSTFLPY